MVEPTLITVGGGSAVLSVSGNDYVAVHASMFAAMTMQLASMANSFYTAPPGPALFVVPNDLGNADVDGSGATADVLVGDGTTLFYHGDANAIVDAGAGNDTVNSGLGNDTIDLGAGNNDITLGTGNNLVWSEGTDSIVSGSGIDTINITGSSTTVYGGFGSAGYTGTSLLVNDTGGTNSFVFAPTKGSVVDGSNNSFTTVVAFGNTTVNGGTQGDHLYAGNGAEITLTGNANGNVLVANDGRWANGNFVDLNGAQATGNNQFWAGSGNSTLVGGTGADSLIAGSGNVTMTGGAGQGNEFIFFATANTAGGLAEITDFGTTSANRIFLVNYGSGGVQQALSTAHQQGGNTVFSFDDGTVVTTVTLDNFNRSNLVATSFN